MSVLKHPEGICYFQLNGDIQLGIPVAGQEIRGALAGSVCSEQTDKVLFPVHSLQRCDHYSSVQYMQQMNDKRDGKSTCVSMYYWIVAMLPEDSSKPRQKAKHASLHCITGCRCHHMRWSFLPIKALCARLMDWSAAEESEFVEIKENIQAEKMAEDRASGELVKMWWSDMWIARGKNLFVSPELVDNQSFLSALE